MITVKEYDGVIFEDLEYIFRKTNIEFYGYITSIGLELDLSNKDQQKIYLHHIIINICINLKLHNNKIVFYINSFHICNIQSKMIKKLKQMFGIRIWESPYPLKTFITKLRNREVGMIDGFELWLNAETKPKTFKHIKKYLNKEGFNQLSDTFFQDLSNKMSILC